MKKFISILVKTILGIIGFVILATILFAVFFPQEKVRQLAEEQMQKQLHRQVTIKKLHISLWRGIIIKNVKISEYPSFKKGTFISCKAFVLKYDLCELMHKRFLLKALVLDSPEINVKRYKNDKDKIVFNFSDLLPEKKEGVKKAKKTIKPTEKPKTKKAKSEILPDIKSTQIPINIEIHELGLKNANIHVTDLATPKFKDMYSLNNVHFLLSNIDIKKNKQMKISTGFGVSVVEYKEGVKTDKSINLDTEIAGKFILFDKTKKLNPEGTLTLQLANGKFYGIQLYKELVNQGTQLTEDAQTYQKDILSSYEKAKKSVDEIQKNKEAQKYAGKLSGTLEKANQLASKLDKIDMGFISKAMDIGFLKDNFEFDKLETVLRIKDQKVLSDNIKMDGQDVRGEGKGYTKFNTEINYNFNLIGNKKYNNNLLTQSLANNKGEVVLPLLITGTIYRPKVMIQGIDIQSIIKKALKEKLGPDADVLLGGTSSLKDVAKEQLDAAKEKLKKEAQKKLDAEKAKAQAELKRKEEELKKKAEEEKRKAEDEAKRKAAEEAKKKLEQSGVKIPKF